MFKRRTAAPAAAQASPGLPPGPAGWPGLFLGAYANAPVAAGPERAALVLGPPRSGKTTSVVIPNVIAAPGAVVVTSTKTDVLAVTARHRHYRGRVWLFDPTGATPAVPGVVPLQWSPVTGCADWATAVARAHALAGAARPGRGLAEATHWTERAEALLAPLLHAAALAGLDMAWPLRWVLRHDGEEPAGLLAAKGGHALAGEVLTGIGHTDHRERSGIFSTAAGILAAYRDPAALAAATHPNFDPAAFAGSTDTVYICAPATAQAQTAPLVVALLDGIRREIYRRPLGAVPVVFALDEVANIAPLPDLPAIVSEGGGQGLVTLACLQDLSQARGRWGPAADGFLSLFASKVILPGVNDLATLKLISSLAGEVDAQVCSVSKGPAENLASRVLGRGPITRTWSTQRRPALPVDQIARGYAGYALAVNHHWPLNWVRLTPWWAWPWMDMLQAQPHSLAQAQPQPALALARP